MKLTNIQIKNAKPKDTMYRLGDGDNLLLEIHPNGKKHWRVNYVYNKKRRQVALGPYPLVSLAEARELKIEKQKLLLKGVDPVEERRQQKIEHEINHVNTLEAIAREWHEHQRHAWKERHAKRILERLEVTVFPFVGSRPIKAISPQEILSVLRKIEGRGSYDMAHRVMQFCSNIYRYAVATGRAERDITVDLRGALKPAKTENLARLSEAQLPGFLQKLEIYDTEYNGHIITKLGFKILFLTFVRSAELREATWSEIDFDKQEWRIPAERMKMKEQHIVPLSTQAIAVFKQIKEITDNLYGDYILPSRQTPRKTMSENTFLKVIDILGYKGKATAHGCRGTASTILNENGFRADVIERQLAHCERDQIRAAYNHAQYLPERKQMMQWWGDYLGKAGMKV
jgi:hypothetical protein